VFDDFEAVDHIDSVRPLYHLLRSTIPRYSALNDLIVSGHRSPHLPQKPFVASMLGELVGQFLDRLND
jgi:hypothetical protein